VEFIFSLNDLNQEGYFIERGAYIYDGNIGLYFALITEKENPKSISKLSSELINRNTPFKEYEDGKKHWYFPNHADIVKRTLDSFSQKNNQNEQNNENQFVQINPTNPPQSINVSELTELLSDAKNVLMFTGAGISVSSGVPDMSLLNQLIDESFNPTNDYIIELINNNSKKRLSKVIKLHGLFVNSAPSISHLRISDLYSFFCCDLITGNLDGLHEKTGVIPKYYTDPKNEVDNLGEYDVLLTIGLGEEGNMNLTDKYRNANSTGKVIAINKECPPYLLNNDYWIPGNCDEILEKLCVSLKIK